MDYTKYLEEFNAQIVEIAEEMLDQGYDEGGTDWLKAKPVETDPDVNVHYMLELAIKNGNFAFACKIFQHPNYNCKRLGYPVSVVIRYSSVESVQLFFSNSTYSKHIKTPLKEYQSMLEKAASDNPKLIPVLWNKYRAETGHDLNPHLFVELSSTLCQPEEDDHTNFVEIARFLLDAGFKILVQTESSLSPLYKLCDTVRHRIRRIELAAAINESDSISSTSEAPSVGETSSSWTLEELSQFFGVTVQNGRLLLKVYGSDVRDCVDLLASHSPNEELQMGLQGAIHSIIFVIDLDWNHQEGTVAGTKHIIPTLKCVQDLVKSLLYYFSDLDCKNPYDDYLCYVLFRSLAQARKPSHPAFRLASNIYLEHVLAILKELVRYKSFRILEYPHALAQLLVEDCDRYLPFLEAFIFHQTDTDGRAFLARMKPLCEDYSRTGSRLDNVDTPVICAIDSYLNAPLSLKHITRKRVVQSLGGTVRVEIVHMLPIPEVLQDFIFG